MYKVNAFPPSASLHPSLLARCEAATRRRLFLLASKASAHTYLASFFLVFNEETCVDEATVRKVAIVLL